MITIQGFAKICGCSTQTLRYYDRIDLLNPVKVDKWTGYRYYEEEQALLFVKIKKLQQADFSIEEIKTLLPGDDDLLMSAFDQKIKEQKRKLEQIQEIQRSYLKEKMEMQKMIYSLIDLVEGRMNNPVLWEEIGLDIKQDSEIRAKIHEKLADWLARCRDASTEMTRQINAQNPNTLKEITDILASGNPDSEVLIFSVANEEGKPQETVPLDAQKVFERSGWAHVSEWIKDIPELGNGKQNYFLFRVCGDSPVADPGFPTLMLAVMDVLYGAMKGGMNCTIDRTSDGLNHFELMQAL